MNIDLLEIDEFCYLSGWKASEIKSLINQKEWIEGREFTNSPTNAVFISIEGYEKWVDKYRKNRLHAYIIHYLLKIKKIIKYSASLGRGYFEKIF